MFFIKDQVKPGKAGGNLSVGDSDRMDFTEDDSQPTETFEEPNEGLLIPDGSVDDVDENIIPPQQQQLIAIEARKL